MYRARIRLPIRHYVFLRTSVAILVLACVSWFQTNTVAAETKPNIVFIVGDDCGYNEFSFQGGSIATPRIDSIAAGGVTLTQGYVSAAVCAPSRAGLLTGRYQQRFGFLSNLPMKQLVLEGLPLTETMLPEVLHAGGYRNIAIGKWHLGWDPKFHPCERCFDNFTKCPLPTYVTVSITSII